MMMHRLPSRRDVLRAAGCGASLAAVMDFPGMAQRVKQSVFVLVHPAWHGAWCWKKIVPRLRKRGHSVFTPTLTGLGERSHLARPEFGLDTHVSDIVNVLKYEGLRKVVLVGHSSSGAVITGVADQAPEHVGHVVYLRTNPAAERLRRTYIRCPLFQNARFDQHAEMAKRTPRWRYRELATSHHPAITAPDKLVDLLVELAS